MTPKGESAVLDTYLHAACPNLPSIPLRIPDAINEPNALDMILPQYNIAVRKPISFLVYHLDSKNKAP